MGCGSSTEASPPQRRAPTPRQRTPTPEPEPVPKPRTPTPEPEPVPNPRTPTPEPEPKARTPTPEPKPRTPTPEPEPVPKPRTPTPEPEQEQEQLPAQQEEDVDPVQEPEEEKPVEEEDGDQARDPTPPPRDQEDVDPPAAPQADLPDTPRDRDKERHKYRRRQTFVEQEDEEESFIQQQTQVRMGRKTVVVDTREEPWVKNKPVAPDVTAGELFTDPDFPQEVAMKGEAEVVEWKRPKDICENPQLFTEGTTRFDIQQGGAGTCWFLSILAALGDKPEVIKQVIPEDTGALYGDDYNGVFHCRFFRNGEWHDVYCDDYLPVLYDKPWGARASDDNEMWVSLMEKAFAKFHGGYTQIYGGWAGNSFIALTGGVAERVETEDVNRKQLFNRVKNALKSGSVIACSVPADKDGECGLVGGHAYTLTGAIRIGFLDQKLSLLRVRNPWGVGKGEWEGKWSDNSDAWGDVPGEVKDKLKVEGKEDGEFWMEVDDYFDYFRDTHICNFTPDFDKDGTTDGLDQVVEIFGEWKGKTAAGSKKKMECQKYVFKVTDEDLDEDGMAPVVIQLTQTTEDRHDNEYVYMRADLYEIAAEHNEDGKIWACDELTNYTNYFGGESYCYRYKLQPGYYLLVPHTMDAGKENGFIVRIFSRTLFPAAESTANHGMFLLEVPKNFDANDRTYDIEDMRHHFLEWKEGENAGGQVSNDTFHINPQITLDLRNSDDELIPVVLAFTQEHSEDILAIGYKLFKIPDDCDIPVDLNWLYDNYSSAVSTTDGKQVFVVAETADGHYLLEPARYLLIVFTDDPGVERKLCFTLGLTGSSYKEGMVSMRPMPLVRSMQVLDDKEEDGVYHNDNQLRHAGLL